MIQRQIVGSTCFVLLAADHKREDSCVLAHEDGLDAFKRLREDQTCPVVPHKPQNEFASLECMAVINARPMTLRIEEELNDEFKTMTAKGIIAGSKDSRST